LGEERAKSATVAAHVEQLEQQVRRQEADLQQWEQAAHTLRKQWEESEWYLGESRAQNQHVQAQLEQLNETSQRADQLEQERSESLWHLGQEQATREAMERQLVELQISLDDAGRREKALREQLAALRDTLAQQELHSERRDYVRKAIAETMVEVFNGGETPLFSGTPRDIGRGGIGLELDAALPVMDTMQVRLALPGAVAVESRAQIAWQQSLGETPGRYRTGIRFLELSAAAAKRIERSLSSIAVKP
jgi:DNA repair exonuclease SbcCD ATPase subunit